MRTVERTVFKFSELSATAKERAKTDYASDEGYSWQNEAFDSLKALASTTLAECGLSGCQWLVAQHQVDVYRKQMAKSDADCEENKRAATYWWIRFYQATKQERPRAFESATEEFAASHEALLKDRENLKHEWAVMARACGNWREWPGQALSDHDHPDWKAAARAIVERDRLANFLDKCESFLDSEAMASSDEEVAEVIERFVKEARA